MQPPPKSLPTIRVNNRTSDPASDQIALSLRRRLCPMKNYNFSTNSAPCRSMRRPARSWKLGVQDLLITTNIRPTTEASEISPVLAKPFRLRSGPLIMRIPLSVCLPRLSQCYYPCWPCRYRFAIHNSTTDKSERGARLQLDCQQYSM